MHLHACVTDGVFVQNGDAPPAFLPARPIVQADLAAVTERVRRRVVRWFKLNCLLDAAAAVRVLGPARRSRAAAAKHRHRYHGVLAPNHKLRSAVTALAIGNVGKRGEAAAGRHASGSAHAAEGCCHPSEKPRSHDTSRITWARLMARVGEEFPLECPWVWR